MSEFYHDVVIVGAGPTGLLSAILAHARGLDVCVVEYKSRGGISGHAHFLNAYSLRILHSVGIDLEFLYSQSTPMQQSHRMAYCTSLSNVFASVDLQEQSSFVSTWHALGLYGGSMNVPFHILYQSLLNLCIKLKVNIHWECSLSILSSNTENVSFRLDYSDSTRIGSSQWLLACDGSHSGIARSLGIDYTNKNAWQSFLSVEVIGSIREFCTHEAMLYWIYHPQVQACMVAHDLDHYQVLQIPVEVEDGKSPFSHADLNNFLSLICGRLDKASIPEIGKVCLWHMQSHLLEKMQCDRVLFLGDCVHAMTPAGGMGMNAGLADAFNLIWKLASTCKTKSSVYIDSFSRERLPVVANQVQMSVENYRDFLALPKLLGIKQGQVSIFRQSYRYLHSLEFSNTYLDTLQSMFTSAPQLFLHPKYGFRFLQESVDKALEGNAKHFQGLEQHVDFTYVSDLIHEPYQGHLPFFLSHTQFLSGRLLPFVIMQDKSSLDKYLQYRKWIVVLGSKQSIWRDLFLKHLDACELLTQDINYYPKDSHFRIGTSSCLIIRPDGIVALMQTSLSDKPFFTRLFSLWFQ
ncbi:MAG: FAD-dependent monooxygenase [Pseudomonadota bacterium]|nr:FAD-dependent monooxygenase [Pseudomonadota bacterium]